MKQEYPLAEFVIRELVFKLGEDFVLHPKAEEGFKLALDDVFDSALDPKIQIEAVARLGALLESRYHAFAVADGIAHMIAGDDRALALLALPLGKRARILKKQFQKLSGEEMKNSAPRYGEAAPEGTLKVSSFFEPGRATDRTRR